MSDNKNNTGDRNSGDSNSGDRNSGDRNSGDSNSGYRNSGDSNSGYSNSGDRNSGYRNSGYSNSGEWNSCDKETGYFNSYQSETIRVFNKDCDREVWDNVNKPSFLYFNLTEWVGSEGMTDEDKLENPHWETTCGYLRSYDYKEAFQKSYNNASQEEKDLLLTLPNFDADVFFEISGIDVRKPDNSDKIQKLKDAQEELIKKAEEIQAQIKELDK